MEYTVKVNENDISILSAALVELPFKVSAPLIDKLNRQIAEQSGKNTDAEQAKEEK